MNSFSLILFSIVQKCALSWAILKMIKTALSMESPVLFRKGSACITPYFNKAAMIMKFGIN